MRRLRAMLSDRRRWIAAAVGALVLAGLVVAGLNRDRYQSPVSVRREIEGFRAGTGGRMPPGSPPHGVYVYATSGYEEIALLGGARHRYPATTTVTIVAGGCGYWQRWVALRARSDETELCPTEGAAWRLAAERQVHEFFGHRDERTYRCARGSLARPARLRAGTRFSAICTIPGTRERQRAVVIATDRVVVGGAPVPAVHVRVRTTISGDTIGTGTTDLWLRISDGLVLRRRERNHNATGTIAGAARYTERYELRLRSLRPRR